MRKSYTQAFIDWFDWCNTITLYQSITFIGDSHCHRSIKNLEKLGYVFKREWTQKFRGEPRFLTYILISKPNK